MTNGGNSIVVIGNGCAAAECVKALRDNGYSGEIHLFTDSKWPVYNPMLSTYYLAGKISFDQQFPYGAGDDFYREYSVEVHSFSPVIALDAEKRTVANKSGFEIKFSRCLIASGAAPVKPRVEGVSSEKVYVLRTVEDAVRLKEALRQKPRKALVIGASMVGIKLMELFHNLGIEVCLIDLAARIFPLTAHPECSRIIQDRLSIIGIKLRLGSSVEKFAEIPGGIQAYFDNQKESEEAGLAVICIGVQPNLDFIDRKDIEVKQGVLVDERLQTNIPGIFAAGDVSQGKNLINGSPQIIGLWDNARYQGRAAGSNMAGKYSKYPGSIPHNITHFLGMDFAGIGDICEYDKIETTIEGNRLRQLFWKGPQLTGANFVDSCEEAGIIKNSIVKGLLQNKSNYGDAETKNQFHAMLLDYFRGTQGVPAILSPATRALYEITMTDKR